MRILLKYLVLMAVPSLFSAVMFLWSFQSVARSAHPAINNIAYPWSIGLAGMASTSPYINSKTNYLVLPTIGYRGERLSVLGPMVSYRLLGYPGFNISADLSLYSRSFSPSDTRDSRLKKLDTRRYTYMAGLNGVMMLNRHFGFNVGLDRSLFGASNAYELQTDLMGYFPFSLSGNRLAFTPRVGLKWSSASLVNYYYGVSAAEASRSGLSQYQPGAGVSPYASLSVMYLYHKRWALYLTSSLTRLSTEIENSPMVGRRYIIGNFLSATYSF